METKSSFLISCYFWRVYLKQKFIAPGTNWCGPSNRALKYGELGGFWQTDKCCRKHDMCKLSIPPLRKKYSSMNTGLITLSHCSCDRRWAKLILVFFCFCFCFCLCLVIRWAMEPDSCTLSNTRIFFLVIFLSIKF